MNLGDALHFISIHFHTAKDASSALSFLTVGRFSCSSIVDVDSESFAPKLQPASKSIHFFTPSYPLKQ
jgi:hypothetical protein